MRKEYDVQFDKDVRFNVKFTEGIRGASAYEVALQNSFSGTEEEWLASLKAETDKEEIAKLAGAAIKDYLAENPISQTQADWNQTDETAVDYVKNRTHYTEVVLGASTTYIARYYTGNDTMGDKNMSTALVYAFDNVKLTFENEAVLQSNVLTGETRTLVFVIGAGTLTMVATANNGTINVTNNTGISQRVVWEYPSSVEVVVHQIDEKFIPETIARTADVVATPPAATVGQTIVVKSVDNTGKPTAWEAVDMAESVEIPETLPNPNKLTFTGAVTAEYDGSVPVTVEIPEGGGGASGGVVCGGWKKVYEYVWDGNLEFQPLTLDYATGEMTFDEAPVLNNAVFPALNFDKITNERYTNEYSKIPAEFMKSNATSNFTAGTNGYIFGGVTSIVEGGINERVDISAFHFERANIVPTFDGLNTKRCKIRVTAPGGNVNPFNSNFTFAVNLSNGKSTTGPMGTLGNKGSSRILDEIIEQEFIVHSGFITMDYWAKYNLYRDRTIADQNTNDDFIMGTKSFMIVDDDVTITSLSYVIGNRNYIPCNGTIVEVFTYED